MARPDDPADRPLLKGRAAEYARMYGGKTDGELSVRESVLVVCLGCKLHGLLVRRGWATEDPAFEVCAHGDCELPERAGA